ncbi:hypothetical protein FDY93_19220 [Microbulbifer harenosus]|uniref:Uncharacterized protein n=1 Tax=Microbulbifer harenosus TaxID=2576840 RepID=A0ABY2UCG4_9GAMM|nr:hypothetical protein FDY93_19220 [Microbulbifer harenosus]
MQKFKTRREVDMHSLSAEDSAAAKVLEKQGWDADKIKEVLESGNDFKAKPLRPGDKLYGFNTAGRGKDLKTSAYWLDESGFEDAKARYFKDGVWDREGLKNHLALPCYNRATAIDVAEVTRSTTAVEARIGRATELLQYTDNSGYSTGLMGKIMRGGGTQVTVDPSTLKAVSGG